MSLAVITVNAPSTAFSTRNQEVALVARALELASHAIRAAGGVQTSGNITDTGAAVIGSYVYSPVAPS
jgi:hypothetical protein